MDRKKTVIIKPRLYYAMLAIMFAAFVAVAAGAS
jgi:hypothetical protein